jgi:hypothetical protein
MMGGALGLAALASIADSRTSSLLSSGHSLPEALTGGYHVAFFVAALFALGAAVIGGTLLVNRQAAGHEQAEGGGTLAAAEAE